MDKRAYYDKRNKRRALVIDLITKITEDHKLATSLRDRGNKYLLQRFSQLELVNGVLRIKKKTKKAKKIKEPESRFEERDDDLYEIDIYPQKKESKNEKRRRLYKEARDAGYTPEEARKLRGKAQESFNKTIQFNRVLDNENRYKRWSRWGKKVADVEKKIDDAEKTGKSASFIYNLELKKRSIYPQWIQDLVDEVNGENGYDFNSSYGWNVVYMYYTEGGTIEFWKSFYLADPLNPNIYKAKTKLVVSVSNRARRLK